MEASSMRRGVLAMLAVFLIASVFTVERMTEPEQAQACPVCVVAGGVGLYEIAATGLGAAAIAGGTAAAINAIDNSASKAREVVRHPGQNSRFLHNMRQYRTLGNAIWRHVNRSLSRLYRFVRARVSLHHIKRKLPAAAWACGVMGITSYLMNANAKDALKACIGAATSVLFIGGKRESGYAGAWMLHQYQMAMRHG